MESDTNFTDAVSWIGEGGVRVVRAEDAQILERELAAAKAELVRNADKLAAAIKQRDEAHSLIRTWKVNLVDVVDDGEIMYAMTSEGRCSMNDAHKRTFLAATRKEGGGA